jgi:DNA repair exonuclease SbcCD ATPase subunit
MSDRATPETDAEIDAEMTCACYPKEYVSGYFARKLERERDEANDKMVSAECDVREIASAMEKVKQERDEARRERDELKDILRELLDIIPEQECHDFGHTKEERHSMFETCPVMERYDGLIEQARKATK